MQCISSLCPRSKLQPFFISRRQWQEPFRILIVSPTEITREGWSSHVRFEKVEISLLFSTFSEKCRIRSRWTCSGASSRMICKPQKKGERPHRRRQR